MDINILKSLITKQYLLQSEHLSQKLCEGKLIIKPGTKEKQAY